jgi:hypothetical protein
MYFISVERVDGESFIAETGRKTKCNRSALIADHRTAAKCDFGGGPGYSSLPSHAVTWLTEVITRISIFFILVNHKYIFQCHKESYAKNVSQNILDMMYCFLQSTTPRDLIKIQSAFHVVMFSASECSVRVCTFSFIPLNYSSVPQSSSSSSSSTSLGLLV